MRNVATRPEIAMAAAVSPDPIQNDCPVIFSGYYSVRHFVLKAFFLEWIIKRIASSRSPRQRSPAQVLPYMLYYNLKVIDM